MARNGRDGLTAFLAFGWPLAALCFWRWRHDRKLAWDAIATSRKWEKIAKEACDDADDWKEAADMWEREAGIWQVAALRPFRPRAADPLVKH